MTLTQAQWDAQSERIRAGRDLVQTIPQSELDMISDGRRVDIIALTNGVISIVDRIGINAGTMEVISVAVQVAYAFGKRDAQPVPDAFANALDDTAPPASETGGDRGGVAG